MRPCTRRIVPTEGIIKATSLNDALGEHAPWCRTAPNALLIHIKPLARDLAQASLEEPSLRPVLGELERPPVGVACLLGAAEAPQEIGPGRVVVAVLVEPSIASIRRTPSSTSPASATAAA